jgi:hypothetical protein
MRVAALSQSVFTGPRLGLLPGSVAGTPKRPESSGRRSGPIDWVPTESRSTSGNTSQTGPV